LLAIFPCQLRGVGKRRRLQRNIPQHAQVPGCIPATGCCASVIQLQQQLRSEEVRERAQQTGHQMAGHHLQNTAGVFLSTKNAELQKSEHKVFVLGDFAVLRYRQENLKTFTRLNHSKFQFIQKMYLKQILKRCLQRFFDCGSCRRCFFGRSSSSGVVAHKHETCTRLALRVGGAKSQHFSCGHDAVQILEARLNSGKNLDKKKLKLSYFHVDRHSWSFPRIYLTRGWVVPEFNASKNAISTQFCYGRRLRLDQFCTSAKE